MNTGSTEEQLGNMAVDLTAVSPSVAEHFAKFEITFMNQDASLDAVNRAMFIHQNAQLPPGVCVFMCMW